MKKSSQSGELVIEDTRITDFIYIYCQNCRERYPISDWRRVIQIKKKKSENKMIFHCPECHEINTIDIKE